ncbi:MULTISPECIES: M3 family metallopeptidase [unclassified Corynebacterium]|uniref:M3 family metallopeptidase n=1 Tax=unclassified Corynebacterium TaxID=2624378 RepID=UPI001EF3F655|nr:MULTISPECIES: M3 family metallopeptidase [unclassified Corynebacterium]MCG7258790.1 M3 family metallopeptidase [Corynebacterium sp. ACRQK]MCG7263271.1 M3 family metallopeptidase [Corynebacterium sp. ACRQL]
MDYLQNVSELPYELPDFAAIDLAELVPAFRTALVDHAAQIAAIANNPETPTWENTAEAWEESGQMLQRVLAIVFNYTGANATDQVREIEATISPELARHFSEIWLNRKLWKRICALPEQPEGSEEEALLRELKKSFIRGGAELDDAQRESLRDIDAQLAELTTAFGAQLQTATEDAAVLLNDEAEVAGLSTADKEYFAKAAAERGEEGWLIRLGLPSIQPVLELLENPAARAKVHEASLNRGAGSNEATLLQIVRLRAQRAELLGFANHAEFVAAAETAGSLSAVEELLNQVTPAAVANAHGEYKRALDKMAVSGAGDTAGLSGADWPYWDAKLRAEELDVDEAELKKYFPLEQVMVDGAFFAAKRLYGIDVRERTDLVGYAPGVRVWEVTEGEESPVGIGLLLTDMYARPTKRGGAWMNSFVEQSNLLGKAPVVVNVMNIAEPAEGEQALLTLDEVQTVFHEFGHALHGLLSDVRYPTLSGTNVPRDFVEFPSQINENWALEPAVLRNYARHVETGEVISGEFVDAIRAQAKWGQGLATTEFLAACWLDLAWHKLSAAEAEKLAATDDAAAQVESFEAEALERAGVGVNGALAPRYRSAYFNHIFAGGYSADYWSYLWAEVLDADGFQAFVDTGAAVGESNDATADLDEDDVRFAGERFRRIILSRGASIDFEDAFWMFRGQQRSVQPLLDRRGLSQG